MGRHLQRALVGRDSGDTSRLGAIGAVPALGLALWCGGWTYDRARRLTHRLRLAEERVADRMNIASFAFGSMVDRLESLPEAPDTPDRRRRAAWIMLGFGLDPGQHGISLDGQGGARLHHEGQADSAR